MSESLEGLIVPATRQKDGRLGSGRSPGGVKDPAGSSSAVAMVVFGMASETSESHVAANAGTAARSAQSRRMSVLLFACDEHAGWIEALLDLAIVQDLEAERIDQLRHALF